VGNGAVVMTQENLFNIESETTTESLGDGLYCSQITGDLGEIEFDRFCTQNNIVYYKASSGASAVDRIIYTKNGITLRIHVKASILCKREKYAGQYNFKTAKNNVTADYYFCVGFEKATREKNFILWLPYQNFCDKNLAIPEGQLWRYSIYSTAPKEIINSANIFPFLCP
jgi:hypothetical protein